MTDERIRRCGPLSACSRNGHAGRADQGPIEDHIWRYEEFEAQRLEALRAREPRTCPITEGKTQ